ncbi:MAG: hypothetical protein F6K41_42595, partial [Symploca sp. SIO3E6]|nr:hypothetical protein [Caldora sp. SIO3E6]
ARIVETFHETSQSKISWFAQNRSIVTGFGINSQFPIPNSQFPIPSFQQLTSFL